MNDPKKFGRYEILAELGRGGMGAVYHAYDPVFDREVAIKVLPRELLQNTELRARFQREARTIAKLEHPNVVPVYDFGTEDSQPFLVMRYLSGGSLQTMIADGKFLELRNTTAIIQRLASGMDYVHQRGIIHRDLKPDNILFDDAENPYIADFGIAKLEEVTTSLTSVNAVIGTYQYMSPEQMQPGQDIDHRTDIYALGVIVFRMLVGQPPYRGTQHQVAIMTLTAPIPDIREANPQVPATVQPIINTALAKEKENRYATASQLAEALAFVAEQSPASHVESEAAPTAASQTQKIPALLPTDFKTIKATTSPANTDPNSRPLLILPKWLWIAGGSIVGIAVVVTLASFVLMRLGPPSIPTPTGAATTVADQLPLENTRTPSPTPSLSNTPTPSPSDTHTRTPSATTKPTSTPTGMATPARTATPTVTPQIPLLTFTPTTKPTEKPENPTPRPTNPPNPPTSPPEPTAADPPTSTPAQPP